MRPRWDVLLLVFAWSATLVSQSGRNGGVTGSSHDFSVASPSGAKAKNQTDVCIFCHTSHTAAAMAPLWNHRLSGQTYKAPYSSSTMTAAVGTPQAGDSSKLCLGCHDGTVAIGDTINNGMIPFQAGTDKLPPGRRSNLGMGDLSDNHPFAFAPNTGGLNPQLKLPPPGDAVKLDSLGKVQCVTCHDAHEERKDPTEARFLVKNNSASAICTTCHDLKGSAIGGLNAWSWSGVQGTPSDHKTATNAYTVSTNARGIAWLGAHTGYSDTATNGCEACHRPHTAHQAAQLLKGQTDEVCFQCHDGNATTNLRNVKAEFTSSIYAHPGMGTSQAGHTPDEVPTNIMTRHAACNDCHNPHAARTNTAGPAPSGLSPALLGVSGASANWSPRDPRRGTGDALHEYEICFKCHADSPGKPQNLAYAQYGRTPYRLVRGSDPYNVRLEFAGSPSVSGHNVTTALSGRDVPSLRDYMINLDGSQGRTLKTMGSYLSCTDCHNNEEARISKGTGPNGPHGSNWMHLLERRYELEGIPSIPGGGDGSGVSYQPGINGTYALCHKCHDIGSGQASDILRDNTFLHSRHVVTAKSSCSTCHAPHGIPSGGTVAGNRRLVNFDTAIVAPNAGTVAWYSAGAGARSCLLVCHGKPHTSQMRY